jgi:hypothetical protein
MFPFGQFMACRDDSRVLAITNQKAITGLEGQPPKGKNATAGYVFGEGKAMGCHTTHAS